MFNAWVGRAPDFGISLPGAQWTRIHPNNKVWLRRLESTYYWKYSVLFRMRNMNSLAHRNCDFGHAFSRSDQIVSTH
jgi:hypothetical protein